MDDIDACDTRATTRPLVDAERLRDEVRRTYHHVADEPDGTHHFHTGRRLARRLGYPRGVVDQLPEEALESFAGIANPFSLRALGEGERVVDAGCGAGFDSFVAAGQVGPSGEVVGVDMTEAMIAKARRSAEALGLGNVTFREGLLECLPVQDGWADTVIANGALNLCADKRQAFAEIWRVLAPGGRLQFGDIANGRPVPPEAVAQIDLWTG